MALNNWPGKGGEVGRYAFGVETFANPIGAIGDYAVTLHYSPREVVVARLDGGVVAQFPVSANAQNATLTVINGRLVAVVVTLDADQKRVGIAYDTGIAVADTAGAGEAPVSVPTQPTQAPVDLTPVLQAVAKLQAQVDALQTDLVGRGKAHDQAEQTRMDTLGAMLHLLPDLIMGEVPAGDHFGMDPRAWFANKWQELIWYGPVERQDFWQPLIERFFEAVRNMKKQGFNPETGLYDLPKQE